MTGRFSGLDQLESILKGAVLDVDERKLQETRRNALIVLLSLGVFESDSLRCDADLK